MMKGEKMIIVSGPDNSGKTSLVDYLVKEVGMDKVKKDFPQPPYEHPDEYTDWVCNTINTGGVFDIVDRCFIDELVYGPIMRGQICFDKDQYFRCIKAISDNKPLFIITDPGKQKIKETFAEREQYPDIQSNLNIQRRYHHVIHLSPFCDCPVYYYDYRFDPKYELVQIVARHYILRKVKK